MCAVDTCVSHTDICVALYCSDMSYWLHAIGWTHVRKTEHSCVHRCLDVLISRPVRSQKSKLDEEINCNNVNVHTLAL